MTWQVRRDGGKAADGADFDDEHGGGQSGKQRRDQHPVVAERAQGVPITVTMR